MLLDTNVVSELRKVLSGKADKQFSRWAEKLDSEELYLSVITDLELEIGVLMAERKDKVKGAVLRNWLNQHVLPAFAGRIIDVDLSIAQRFAQINVPNQLNFRDGLIVCTALVHKMKVVTRNTSDFDSTGVDIINPWK